MWLDLGCVTGVSSSAEEKRGLENHRYQANISIVITDSSSNSLEMAPNNQSHFEVLYLVRK